jgi:V8-like Glu-specific endopeptidase
MSRNTKLLGVLFLVVCALTVFGASKPAPAPVNEAPMETVVSGPTAVEELAAQRDMHQWLTEMLPAGTSEQRFTTKLSPDEAAGLQRSIEEREDPLKVGVVKDVHRTVTFANVKGLPQDPIAVDGGMLRATDDGGFVWATTLRSEGAVGIRVHFAGVDLPASADLYIMNSAGQAFGPYLRQGPDHTGDFWSNTVAGDSATIVLKHHGPDGAAELSRSGFRIAELGHVGPGFPGFPTASTESFCSFNASCILNASCGTTNAAANPAKSAVALMQWIAGAFIYTCTGGLIADTDANTQIPYFLTANHCLSSNNTAANLETYFQFSLACGSTNCPSQTNPGGIQRLGATVKASGSSGDYTLLQLNQTPPAGSVFLGWNNTAVANSNNTPLYRISHPAWAPQSYSAHHVDTGAPTCQGWPRGERIYSRDDAGATEGGSSGSPVVNGSSQIVGQLSGACGFNTGDVCDATSNATVDGALAFYYSSVAPFLSPGGGGCGAAGSTCTSNSQCCSNNCKGPNGRKTCR